MSWTLSPCIEWLFADGARPFHERVREAARAGFTHIEFWTASDKDVRMLETAVHESGVTVTSFVSEPTGRLVDPATHGDFLAGVEQSCRLARRLNCLGLIVVAGQARDGVDRETQARALTAALRRAAPIASRHGVQLLLEPLNTQIDHPGYFLDSTVEALGVVRAVDDPAVKLLYDLYHSIVMGEEPDSVLQGSGQLVGHVHIADVPGRHEPGTGSVDWRRQLESLRASGYSGLLGLEYMPTADTLSSLEFIQGRSGGERP